MSDELAKAAMYAIRAIVEGMRDAGQLPQKTIEAIEERTKYGIYAAGAIEGSGQGFDADEPRAIRHGMWWARECIAPFGDTVPGITEHPRDPYEWPSLELRQKSDEG